MRGRSLVFEVLATIMCVREGVESHRRASCEIMRTPTIHTQGVYILPLVKLLMGYIQITDQLDEMFPDTG